MADAFPRESPHLAPTPPSWHQHDYPLLGHRTAPLSSSHQAHIFSSISAFPIWEFSWHSPKRNGH